MKTPLVLIAVALFLGIVQIQVERKEERAARPVASSVSNSKERPEGALCRVHEALQAGGERVEELGRKAAGEGAIL